MSKKKGDVDLPDQPVKKRLKIKFVMSSSSRSASDAKQGEDDPEKAVVDPPPSTTVDNPGSLGPSMEDRSRLVGDANFPVQPVKKRLKIKFVTSSSSRSASDAKQGEDDPDKGVADPPPSTTVDNPGSLGPSTEDRSRNQDHMDLSSGSAQESSSSQDHDSHQTEMKPSSSSSVMESVNTRGINQIPGDLNERDLVYTKSLTRDDVFYYRLMIPLEMGKEFLPEPEKFEGRYGGIVMSVMDHEGETWEWEAAIDELSGSYMFWLNWDKYVKKHDLKPEDTIFIYDDPFVYESFIVEYEKKDRDQGNPQVKI